MQPTTQLALREAIAATIEATIPSDNFMPEERWKRVRGIKEVTGPGIRTFLVRTLPGAPETDGLYGDGWEQGADVYVYTSYCDLGDDEDGPIIDEDQRQLYCRIVDTIDPTNSGFCAITIVGWNYDNDNPGEVVGYHHYRIRYLVSDQA